MKINDEHVYKNIEFDKKAAQSARKLLKSKKKPTSIALEDETIVFGTLKLRALAL